MVQPSDPPDVKERHLRALYREHAPGGSINEFGKYVLDYAQAAEQRRIVRVEYERLYGEPTRDGALERILTNAWIEARELAGERYCHTAQKWIAADEADVR